MPLTFTPAQKNLLDAVNPAHAYAWTIVRTDGRIYRFTSAQESVELNGNTFKPAGGYTVSAREQRWRLGLSDADFSGAIDPEVTVDSDDFAHEELVAGEFREAIVTEEFFDVRYPWMGAFASWLYLIGESRYDHEVFQLEISAHHERLNSAIGVELSRSCRNVFGDSRCGFDLNTIRTQSFTVGTVVTQHLVFRSSGTQSYPDFTFDDGIIEWISGANAGKRLEVRRSTQQLGTIALHQHTPYEIQSGDTFRLVPGCRRTLEHCTIFGNSTRFGGYPYMPTSDTFLQVPEART